MTRIYTKFAAVAVLASALGGLSTPALADVVVKDGSMSGVPRQEVRFADLNLDSQAGIDTLNQRLAVAVRRVCGDVEIHELKQAATIHDCREDSLTRAYADRDALLATRIAVRSQPGQLAVAPVSAISIVARH